MGDKLEHEVEIMSGQEKTHCVVNGGQNLWFSRASFVCSNYICFVNVPNTNYSTFPKGSVFQIIRFCPRSQISKHLKITTVDQTNFQNTFILHQRRHLIQAPRLESIMLETVSHLCSSPEEEGFNTCLSLVQSSSQILDTRGNSSVFSYLSSGP